MLSGITGFLQALKPTRHDPQSLPNFFLEQHKASLPAQLSLLNKILEQRLRYLQALAPIFALYLQSEVTEIAAMSEFGLWQAPDDPDKPPSPYITGFTTKIHRHAAPPPFGIHHYEADPRPQLSSEYMKKVPQSELVVDNPPLETPPSQAETAELFIDAPIAVGSNRGAQVVTCSITPHGENACQPFQAVAKIYDALYYEFSESIGYQPRDVVSQADQDYSREAAAYKYLQETGQTGSFAPAYYGSWTLALPISSRGKAQTRPVRLILIEHLDGESIRDSIVKNEPWCSREDAFHYPYPEEYRLEVLALAMDGYVRQRHSGIDQRDFAARNLMLISGEPLSEPDQSGPVVAGLSLPRIVLFDYNLAIVYTQTKRGRHPHMDWPRPCNPMQDFWTEAMDEFWGWVPREWHFNPKFKQEWLKARFGTEEKRKLYAPVEEELVVRDSGLPGASSWERHANPDYEPRLSLKADGFRVPDYNPREPRNSCKGEGDNPHVKSADGSPPGTGPGAPAPVLSGGAGSEKRHPNVNYEPPLSLKDHGFTPAPLFEPTDPFKAWRGMFGREPPKQ